MKKRIVALTIVCALAVALMSGCGIVTKNQQRDYDQIIAEVGYSDSSNADYISRTLVWNKSKDVDAYKQYFSGSFEYDGGKKQITKRDLVILFLNAGQSYMQNYDMTMKETFEFLLTSLINQEVLVQEGIRVVYKDYTDNGVTDLNSTMGATWHNDGGVRILENCFTDDEIQDMLRTVYNSYYDQLKQIKEEIEDEQNKNESESPSESASATPTPRPTQAPPASESPSPAPEPTPIPDEANWKSAQKRFEKNLKSSNKELTTDRYLALQFNAQMESALIKKYQKLVEAGATESMTWDDITARYDEQVKQQKDQYENNKAGFISSLESYDGTSFLMYSPIEGYYYVKSMLIGFSDEQNDELAQILNSFPEDQKKQMKDEILNKTTAKDLRDVITYEKNADGEEEQKAFEFPAWLPNTSQYIAVETAASTEEKREYEKQDNPDFKSYALSGNPDVSEKLDPTMAYSEGTTGYFMKRLYEEIKRLAVNDEYRASNVYNVNKSYAENAFSTLIFEYGTDPGMFNNAVDYLIGKKPNPDGTEKFVTAFADAARDAAKDYVPVVRQDGQDRDAYLKARGDAQLATMRVVATEYGWHIIFVTDAVTISTGADGTPLFGNQLFRSDWEEKIEGSFTYRFTQAYEEEVKSKKYNEKSAQIVKKYTDEVSGFIVKYEDRFKDLLALK